MVSMSETLYSDIKNVFPAGFATQGFDPDLSGKLRVMLNILFDIQKAKEKVVLVSNFTQALDLFEEMFKIHDFKFLRLDGRFERLCSDCHTPTRTSYEILHFLAPIFRRDRIWLTNSTRSILQNSFSCSPPNPVVLASTSLVPPASFCMTSIGTPPLTFRP